MDIEFADKKLELIESDRAADTKLPIAVINSLRNKLQFLRDTPDERSIRNWRSLHYEKMAGRGTINPHQRPISTDFHD